MTRRSKCDFCRKAKVKCDEGLPSCSGCVRRGKECTRTYGYAKKDVRFVQVTGEVVNGSVGLSATRSKEDIVPLCLLRSSSPTSGRVGDDGRVVVASKTASAQLSRPFPNSEQFSLLAKWTCTMHRDLGGMDIAAMDSTFWCFNNWTICIPRYIGTCQALDDAIKCYLDCKFAFADPTDTNLLAVQTSKFKAVNSMRLALARKASQPIPSSFLLAVQLLYMVEALIMRSHNTMVTHVKGIISLLIEYKKNLNPLDADGNMISSAMFISTYASGLIPALLSGKDHGLDSPGWLDSQLPPSNPTIISRQATQQAWQTMIQSYVAIPRLARLIRHLGASPENAEPEQEVLDLAQHLYANTIDPHFFPEATSLGELWVEPTIFSEIVDVMPTSYGFKSRKFVALLGMYWMARLLICGLVDKLISTVPLMSRFFDANTLEAGDVRIATEVLMMVQYGFTRSADEDTDTMRTKQMQLLSLLQTAFGAWYRMGEKATASKEEDGDESKRKFQRAIAMKQPCLDLGNQLLSYMQLPLMTMVSMEMVSEMFAGGPIMQCELPDA